MVTLFEQDGTRELVGLGQEVRGDLFRESLADSANGEITHKGVAPRHRIGDGVSNGSMQSTCSNTESIARRMDAKVNKHEPGMEPQTVLAKVAVAVGREFPAVKCKFSNNNRNLSINLGKGMKWNLWASGTLKAQFRVEQNHICQKTR